MLFVEVLDAVEAVLEMVLDMVSCGCPVSVLPKWDSAPKGSVALPAKTLMRGATSRGDEAAPRGVSALSRRAALQRRWLVSCAGYESCAEDSAEPVPRAWPTTLQPQRRGPTL